MNSQEGFGARCFFNDAHMAWLACQDVACSVQTKEQLSGLHYDMEIWIQSVVGLHTGAFTNSIRRKYE